MSRVRRETTRREILERGNYYPLCKDFIISLPQLGKGDRQRFPKALTLAFGVLDLLVDEVSSTLKNTPTKGGDEVCQE